MGIFSAAKWIAAVVALILFVIGMWWVSNLKADLAISEQNNKVLTQSVEDQKAVILQKETDIKQIQSINETLVDQKEFLQKEVENLNEKFKVSANGQSRDFGAITRAKPAIINKIIDKASEKVNRCFELATGAKLNEGEKNDECKELVNSLAN